MSLKNKFSEFEKEFIETWGEYIKLQDELNLYRGKEIGDDADRVNDLITDIQRTFISMYNPIMFVIERHMIMRNALHDYQNFIEDIKKAGAIEEGKAES